MDSLFSKLGFSQKLIIVIALGLIAGFVVNSYLSIQQLKESMMSAMVGKAKAITVEAESAREYMGQLRKKYKVFRDKEMIEEVKQQMVGVSKKPEDIIKAARKTSFYWTVPVVAGWNVAMMKAKEANYVFRVPKIQPRNPENKPTPFEKKMLLKIKTEKLKEHYEIDKANNALRFMRSIKLSDDCMVCHGVLADSITGKLEDPLGLRMEEWKSGEQHGAYEIIADLSPMDDAISKAVRNTIIEALLLIAVLVGIIYMMLQNLVVNPIRKLVDITKNVAGGNFTERVEHKGNDEIGDIASAVNDMSSRLNDTILDVVESSVQLNASADEIRRSSKEVEENAKKQLNLVTQEQEMIEGAMESVVVVNENVDELYRAAEDVSGAVEETGRSIENVEQLAESVAQSVSETSSAIEEMAVSVKNVAQNSEDIVGAAKETLEASIDGNRCIEDVVKSSSEISEAMQKIYGSTQSLTSQSNEVATHSISAGELADITADDAEKGREAMKKAIISMVKIKDVVSKSSEVISGLSTSAEDIGNIIDVIDDIAEQTNLLALNAAIEAARAGEHGRGFAVVADEVRKLAERSGSATKEIADLIKGIQGESEAAVLAMEEGTNEVEGGVTLAENSGSALERIIQGVDKTKELVKQITIAAEQQKEATGSVAQAVSNVSRLAEQIEADSAKASDAGRNISDQVKMIDTMAIQIANATNEQADAAKQVADAVSNINDGSQQVKNAMKEQSIAVNQIVQAVSSINIKSKEVKDASEHQRNLFGDVVEATKALESFTNTNIEKIDETLHEVNDIAGKANSLNEMMEQFKTAKRSLG